MVGVDDILKLLDRIPVWKRLSELPVEVDRLKERISELETKLNGKWPGDVCRRCGVRAVRLDSQRGSPGNQTERWKCAECGFSDFRPGA